jgi:hypothetical protein
MASFRILGGRLSPRDREINQTLCGLRRPINPRDDNDRNHNDHDSHDHPVLKIDSEKNEMVGQESAYRP